MHHVEDGVYPGGCFFAAVMPELDTQPGAVRDRALAFMGELARPHRDGGPRRPGRGRDRPGRRTPISSCSRSRRPMMLANAMFVITQEPTPLERCPARRSRAGSPSAPAAARAASGLRRDAVRRLAHLERVLAVGDRLVARRAIVRSTNGSRQRTSASGSGLWKYGIDWRRVFAAPAGGFTTRCGVETQRSFVMRISASPRLTTKAPSSAGTSIQRAVARLRLQASGRGLGAQDREEAVVRVHAGAQLAGLGRRHGLGVVDHPQRREVVAERRASKAFSGQSGGEREDRAQVRPRAR